MPLRKDEFNESGLIDKSLLLDEQALDDQIERLAEDEEDKTKEVNCNV